MQPKLTVALGATAAYALTGNAAPMADRQGRIEQGLHNGPVLVTWHPSYILRLTDAAAQARARADLTAALYEAARRAT